MGALLFGNLDRVAELHQAIPHHWTVLEQDRKHHLSIIKHNNYCHKGFVLSDSGCSRACFLWAGSKTRLPVQGPVASASAAPPSKPSGGAPPPPPPPGPPPPPADLSGSSEHGDSDTLNRSALFDDINRGANVTRGKLKGTGPHGQ